MKIYVAHSTQINYQDELYKILRDSKLNLDHEIMLPHENSTDQFNSKEHLNTCDLVLAEVSSPSIGMGIELGWADDRNVKIICFYKKGSKPSVVLKAVSGIFLEYSSSEDMLDKLSSYL